MSAFGGKADIILGKADTKKCPLMTQSGHAARAARAAISALDPRLTAFGNEIKVPPSSATPWACTGCIQLTLPR